MRPSHAWLWNPYFYLHGVIIPVTANEVVLVATFWNCLFPSWFAYLPWFAYVPTCLVSRWPCAAPELPDMPCLGQALVLLWEDRVRVNVAGRVCI
jgi:hypothetical protein